MHKEVSIFISDARNEVVLEGSEVPLHCVSPVHVGRYQLVVKFFFRRFCKSVDDSLSILIYYSSSPLVVR